MRAARLTVRQRRRVTKAIAALAAALVVAACSAPTAPSTSGAGSVAGPAAAADEYRPGMTATVRLRARRGAADLVVLVPGGGWQTADPAGLVPLAERLTADGAVTSTITYGTASTGAWFPQPADDVACAIRWSAAEAAAAGARHHASRRRPLGGRPSRGPGRPVREPVRIVVRLAAGPHRRAGRHGRRVRRDRSVGHRGHSVGVPQADDPQRWRDGDPTWWAGQREDVAGLTVLLLHGGADTLVPVSQTQGLAALLEARGLDTTVEVVPGQDHRGIYAVDVAGPRIARWLRTQAAPPAG